MKGMTLPDFSKMSRRERVLSLGGVLVVTILLLDRAVLGPVWHQGHRIRKEIQELEHTITTHHNLLSRKDQVMAEVDAHRAYLRADGAGGLEMAALLREVESLGKESGVSLSEVKPLFGTPDEPQYEHALEIRYEGTLQQWVRFIYLLETSKSLFEIERATLALKEEGSDRLEGSLRLGNIIIQSLPQVPESSTETEGKPVDVSMAL